MIGARIRWLALALAPWLAGCGTAGDAMRPPDAGDDADGVGTDGDANPPCVRRVLEGEVTNARDLGDWPLAGGGCVACRRLLRGGTLVGLDSSGCEAFQALGIRTVVDLRDSGTQAASPAPACVRDQAAVIQAPMPKLLPDTVQTYLALLEESASIQAAFGALSGADALPGYVHCEVGRARASVVTALLLLALGAERATVLAEFDLSNQAGIEVHAEHLEAVLDEVESRGGIEAYLLSAGVAAAQIEALRTQALAEP